MERPRLRTIQAQDARAFEFRFAVTGAGGLAQLRRVVSYQKLKVLPLGDLPFWQL
jgi:hypothetical protein